ncbi:7695_t:CDS:2 [Paraglomus brasilianum]|uniref:Mitochondrial zinc maintenance protein 1, mitochondrial n=1 Tax=Paraglomus brasilianum TaxID=144538 RepID=A0A9N8WKK0_9GLOM|nr:7695_t:CDS:2 [Paraglomus brasilianum]
MNSNISNLRQAVLHAYRNLLKTQKQTFRGDEQLIQVGRLKTREEFIKHKDETDISKIEEYIKNADDTAVFLKKNVVQAELIDPNGTYKLHLNEHHELGTNKYPRTDPSTKTCS